MRLRQITWRANLSLAKAKWGSLPKILRASLKDLTVAYGLSIALGDVQLIDGRWYVTHTGLLRLSARKRCSGIDVIAVRRLCESSARRWVFKAIVYPTLRSKGFVGYGDAEPSNVNSIVYGAELRIAETRAVNRALRKAYGIGICSVEELVSSPNVNHVSDQDKSSHLPMSHSNNGQPRLRDRLCLLIREHQFDPVLVKAYAADFCGTATLSGASRELVESFISHLSVAAKENRDGLICKLNSYAPPAEVQP